MNITMRVEVQYGQERIYVTDWKAAAALQALTNRKTISYHDLDALYALGHTVEWITS